LNKTVHRSALRLLYTLYAAAVFLLLALPALVLLVLTPGVRRRRTLARAAARAFLRATGLRLEVRHLDRLPSQTCVVVANHASYLDGLVCMAALPPRFGFVIKREMRAVPLAGLLLRRIGSEFVERFNRHKGGADARRLLRAARGGECLGFFPEGTFTRERGVLKFHSGAFVVAARAGCQIVPIAIRGTRHVMPPGGLLLSPGKLVVEVLEPVAPDSLDCETQAAKLRERARSAIIDALGEPDLAAGATDTA